MPLQPTMTRKIACECRRPTRARPGKECDECQRRECFEWQWEKEGSGTTVVFHNNDRDVIFNPGFSVGTAAVRGSQPFKQGYHHYWEIEMSTEVYGTDMMIGVGTDKTDVRKYTHNFVSLLGIDENSWGLSYSGERKHAGQSHQYSKPFGQHSIVGVHLDLWAGTMEFYIDRKPLGLAFQGLRDKVLYPIISSTAARSGMNLIFCRSYPPSLQLQAMLSLSQNLMSPEGDDNTSIFKVLALPPGMKSWMKRHYWWIVSCRDRERKREEELNNRAKCDKKSRKQQKRAAGIASYSCSGSERQISEDDEDRQESGDEEGGSESESSEEGGLITLQPLFAGAIEDMSQPSSSRRRRRQEDEQQQCTAAQSSGEHSGVEGGGTSCMRLLAATTSRTNFLGRVSPIFVGMPEGGFSILSQNLSTVAAAGPTSSITFGRPVTRSRSAPTQSSTKAGTSSGASTSKAGMVRLPSSDDDDDSLESSSSSARREPKRLKLRSSIEVSGDGEEDDKTKEEKIDKDSKDKPNASN